LPAPGNVNMPFNFAYQVWKSCRLTAGIVNGKLKDLYTEKYVM